jgi:hypothetical protein
MTTSLQDLLAQVATLNDAAQPFLYEVKGNTIVGKWDIVSATSLYPDAIESIDRKFSVTVEFDEKKGTFKSKDRATNSSSSFEGGTLSFGTDSFSGKKSEKSMSFTFGGAHKTKDGVSPVLAYSFDTAKIKDPLFAFLEANGWKKKKGLFG